MRNAGLIGLVLAVTITAVVAARTKILVLKDGREFTGEVTKTSTGYQIKTKHAVITFAEEQVASVTDLAKPEDEYKQRLAKIDPKDAQAHYLLGKWADEKGLLKIARKELKAALDIDPDLEEAILLLRSVNAKLSRISKATSKDATSKTNDNGEILQIPKEWLVSLEDTYRINLAEFKPEVDAAAGIIFRKDVIERFIIMMQGKTDDFNAKRFRRMSAPNKLKTILAETEQESTDSIRNDVLLKKDCKVIGDFRGRIWPIVASKCGSLTCHGAAKGQGQFKLLNITARNDRIDYSNFLILSQYSKRQGRMLDRDNPGESLLLHYGLPWDDERVKYKHPGKKKIAPPPFAKVSDGNYRAIERWIRSLRGPPYGGSYDVKYQAPYGPKPEPPLILNPTTRPAGD